MTTTAIVHCRTGSLEILSTAVLGVLVTMVYNLYLEHKKNMASVTLLRLYAKQAIKSLEDIKKSTPTGTIGNNIIQNIIQGDPYGEKYKNYTPYILCSEEDRLSFGRVSAIFQSLNKEEGEALLAYFFDQTKLDVISHAINSDFVRSLPQSRKLSFLLLRDQYSEGVCR